MQSDQIRSDQIRSDHRSHLRVIPRLQRLKVVLLPRLARAPDEIIERLVDHLHVRRKRALARHYGAQQGDVPVGDVKGGAMLGLCAGCGWGWGRFRGGWGVVCVCVCVCVCACVGGGGLRRGWCL